MRVIHLLRKYDPAEWGGTETAIDRLFEGLRQCQVTSVMYCPCLRSKREAPNAQNGCSIKRFRACVPIWGISSEEKRRQVAVGGNLMSFGLMPALWRERDADVIHTHTLGRLGSIACAVSRAKRLPFVISIHGGLFDLPRTVRNGFDNGHSAGWDWGRVFGALLHSRQLISYADALLTCNAREAELIREHYPHKRVQVQPHGIPTGLYQREHRCEALEAFPAIRDRQVLLCVGRIDPVKNQGWLIEQAPRILNKHPRALLVLAGACTEEAYGERIRQQISERGLEKDVLLTGGLPSGDARLIGLFQAAAAVILPSISETFGLVLLEAWAAGTPVIASRTSGAMSLVIHGENGSLFDLGQPNEFHSAVDRILSNPDFARRLGEEGRKMAMSEYDLGAVATHVKQLYEKLIEEKREQ